MKQYSVTILFKKDGIMRFISHLDLLRLFQRAARRAGLPVMLSQGFNPHPKIKIEPAVKLGVEADNLRAVMRLTSFVAPQELLARIQRELPQGIEVTGIK